MASKIIIPSYNYLQQLEEKHGVHKSLKLDHIHKVIKSTPTKKRKAIQPIHTLDHLHTFVLDEEDIHEEYLKNELEAEVHDNVIISSVQPTGAAQETVTGLPDFWHKQKLDLSATTLTGKGINVGVLDSGIYVQHQEFKGKNITFAHFDKNGKMTDQVAKDFGVHGTHVCGLLAGNYAGVAPEASLTVAAVLTESGGRAGYFAQILGGLNWLLSKDNGVHLINASLESAAGFNNYLYSSLQTAQTSPGTLMVAAIGNDGIKGVNSDTSPGNYNLTIGVGALDQQDNVASFSSWGTVSEMGGIKKPDFSAPGVNLYSSYPGAPGNKYLKQSGTSMAAPVACGVAALLIQQNPSLLYTPEVLKSQLIDGVAPISDVTRGGKGRGQYCGSRCSSYLIYLFKLQLTSDILLSIFNCTFASSSSWYSHRIWNR